MPSTGQRNIVANRWEPFVHTVLFEDTDFTGATFIAQVRAKRDAGGSALVDLSTVGSVATEGITLVSADADGSLISIRINEATMEGLTFPSEVGADATLYWDLQITPSGGVKYRALEGTFTVHAGVTH